MNKATLINNMQTIAKEQHSVELSKKETEAALNAFLEAVTEALVEGDKVQLVGFGTFETRERAARIGKNPKTGEEIEIAASKSAALKVGKALKEKLNA